MPRHLVGIRDLSVEQIEELLHPPDLAFKGGPVALMFHEPSTRTRFSFALAAEQAGCSALHYDPTVSSERKGETLLDTCRNLSWMGVRAFVLRVSQNHLPKELSQELDCPVLNAGDGTNEHPTQALGDARTLLDHFGVLHGLVVSIVGDVGQSRVAHSNAYLLSKMGVQVLLAGSVGAEEPTGPLIQRVSARDAWRNADAIMMLRWQYERGPSQPDTGSYCLTQETLRNQAQAHAVVMHPGPINRGEELESSVADGPRSLIRKQVEFGLEARVRALQWAMS